MLNEAMLDVDVDVFGLILVVKRLFHLSKSCSFTFSQIQTHTHTHTHIELHSPVAASCSHEM